MKKLIALVIVIFFIGCCIDDNPIIQNPQPPKLKHFPLHVGNHWIYEHYKIDTLGNESLLNKTDSIVISGDTLINDNIYYVLEGTNNPFNNKWDTIQILRDSIGYLVNAKGLILFAEDNFIDTFSNKTTVFGLDTISLFYKMDEPDNTITVPAGTFETLNYRGTLSIIHGSEAPLHKFNDNYYANGVGKILQSYHWVSTAHLYRYEKRLVRYALVVE